MQDQKNRDADLLIENAGQLSLLSHDIRTAFTELHLGLAASLDKAQDPTQRNEIRRLHETSTHLGRLIDEASALIFQDSPPPRRTETVRLLKATLMGLCDRWKSLFERMGKSFHVVGLNDLPDRALFDPFALERVLRNLIANSLSHANGNVVDLRFSVIETDGRAQLQICLQDEGTGYPREILSKETFAQPLPVSAGMPGSGFGLRVAFDAAQKLGGTLTLGNTDRGAEALLLIPLSESRARLSAVAGDAQFSLDGHTALVVEDIVPLRKLLTARLREFGMTVYEAADGIEALDMMARPGLDICFLDAELPYLSGVQVMQFLRERGILPPPVVAMTAHASPVLHDLIRQSGAQEIIGKPLPSPPELLSLLKSVLNIEQTDGKTSVQTETSEETRSLARVFESLPKPDAIDFFERLDADFDLYMTRLETLGDKPLSAEARLTLDHVAHCLTGLFATTYFWQGHKTAQDISLRSQTISLPELVALCAKLRQDVKNIQKTLREIITGETDTHVPDTDFSY